MSRSSPAEISPEPIPKEPICFIITRDVQGMGRPPKMKQEIKEERKEKIKDKELVREESCAVGRMPMLS